MQNMNYFTYNGYYPLTYLPAPVYNSPYNFMTFSHANYEKYDTSNTFSMNYKADIFQQNNCLGEELGQSDPSPKQNEVPLKKQIKKEEKAVSEEEKREYIPKTKRRLPTSQKKNRNVVSNLLRIFFKNILEVNHYDKAICSLIQKFKIEQSNETFYQWLGKFKINFKNYIKPIQIKKILGQKNCKDFQKMFRILLWHFMNDTGRIHCLTSKRIDSNCIGRHLDGLKKLLSLEPLFEN